jgi:CheY-like chemotaxis protein
MTPATLPRDVHRYEAIKTMGTIQSMQKTRAARKVLVVDDNEDTVETMTLLLRGIGHEVLSAQNGIHALDMARQFRPDIVFLDLGLPGRDGCEVARQLRREPGLEAVRILAVTGSSRDEDRERFQQAGCDGYLLKPLDPVFLDTLLRPGS